MNYIQNPELQLAFDFVQYTNRNIFLTGKAGTGKTTFLHNLKKVSPKRMVVVAPTGVAAINAGGVTIHSFFQMPLGPQIPLELLGKSQQAVDLSNPRAAAKKFSKNKINIIKSIDLLVIDEISMVRADLLDGIDEVLRRFRNRSKPFGGVQLLMIGDLHQLAPVVKEDEWELLKDYYDTYFFFGSKALQKTNHVSIELKQIFRQSDSRFIRMLNKVRQNEIDNETIDELNKHFDRDFIQGDHEGYITLTTHNYQAQEINESRLKRIDAKPATFKASVSGDFPEHAYPTEFELTLKVGAQVMFVKNDPSREKLFYNGKIGKVEDIDDDTITVNCPGDQSPITVERAEWQSIKYYIDDETKEIKEDVIGTFVQLPLKLAWAITIHKSQGLTFEKAIIDARDAFAHGQVYVALSRCKSLEGLVLSSKLTPHSIKSDKVISNVTRDIEENPPSQQQLNDSKATFQHELLFELFDFASTYRRCEQLLKVVLENLPSLEKSAFETFDRMKTAVKADMVDVAEKFRTQVQQLIAQNPDAEKNISLQERIKKASDYFIEKISNLVFKTLDEANLETDNKAVRKLLGESVDNLKADIKLKLACLNSCRGGFELKRFLNDRALASIEQPEKAKKVKPVEDYSPKGLEHPKLYSTLRSWRDDKSEELEVPTFMILPYKSMILLIRQLPTNLTQLKKVKGLGAKKVKQFGYEITEIIKAYCIENGMQVEEPEIEIPKPQKPAKGSTYQKSLELAKQGKSIPEIAAERSMAVSTIEGHLARYIGSGELDVYQFVEREKVERISDHFSQNQNLSLGFAKEVLGDDVSYSEIRFVLKHMEFQRKE